VATYWLAVLVHIQELQNFNFGLQIHCGPEYLRPCSHTLRAGRSGDRIPVGARFSAPVQTSAGAQPASCTMGTGSFPRVKRPGRDVDHPPLSSAEVKESIDEFIYSDFFKVRPLLTSLPVPCNSIRPRETCLAFGLHINRLTAVSEM